MSYPISACPKHPPRVLGILILAHKNELLITSDWMHFMPWNVSPFSAKLCVNVENGNKVEYEIANLNPTAGFTLAVWDCESQISTIV